MMRKWYAGQSLHTFLVCLCLLVFTQVVTAQGLTPVEVGQNAPGQVTAEAPTALFTIAANAGDSVTIQVLGFAEGFTPHFRVLNPANAEILNVANPDGTTIVSGNASFVDAGTYTIEVSGENGTTGQFLVSVQAGAPLPAPVTLVVGQPVEGIVDAQGPLLYEFSALTNEPVILSIVSKLPDVGPSITLRDTTANKTLASSDSGLTAVVYRVGAGVDTYQVDVRHGGAVESVPFTICLEASTASGACNFGLATTTAEAVATEAAAPVTATCTVSPSTGSAVNVRSGAGTDYGIVGTLQPGQSYVVTAQLSNASWYQISLNGVSGWVAASVVVVTGDCSGLPAIAAPASPQRPPATQAPVVPPPAAPTTASAPPVATEPPPPPPPATEEPPALADLTVSGLTENAEGIRVARTLSAVISNVGEGDAGPFWIAICGLENDCKSQSVAGLAAGAAITVSEYFPNDQIGVGHELSIFIDTEHTVEETNESNNQMYNYLSG